MCRAAGNVKFTSHPTSLTDELLTPATLDTHLPFFQLHLRSTAPPLCDNHAGGHTHTQKVTTHIGMTKARHAGTYPSFRLAVMPAPKPVSNEHYDKTRDAI